MRCIEEMEHIDFMVLHFRCKFNMLNPYQLYGTNYMWIPFFCFIYFIIISAWYVVSDYYDKEHIKMINTTRYLFIAITFYNTMLSFTDFVRTTPTPCDSHKYWLRFV